MEAPFHLILLCAAILLFGAAGLGGWKADGPWAWNPRLIAWGLFAWSLSTIVKV